MNNHFKGTARWQNTPGLIIWQWPPAIWLPPLDSGGILLGLRLVVGLGGSEYRHYFFELSEYEKAPKMKDKNPTAIAEEGVDPQVGHGPEVKKATPLEDRSIYPGEGMALI